MQPQLRLRDSRDFDRLRREGRPHHHRAVTVSLAPNTLPHNRYGFVTGKRLGKAVVRNRARRLLRAAVQQLHPHLKTGFDVVLIAKPALVEQPFHDVKRIVSELLRQAGLFDL